MSVSMSEAANGIDMLAVLQGTGDAQTDAAITALSKLHTAKVRTLMKSINDLKDQVCVY